MVVVVGLRMDGFAQIEVHKRTAFALAAAYSTGGAILRPTARTPKKYIRNFDFADHGLGSPYRTAIHISSHAVRLTIFS